MCRPHGHGQCPALRFPPPGGAGPRETLSSERSVMPAGSYFLPRSICVNVASSTLFTPSQLLMCESVCVRACISSACIIITVIKNCELQFASICDFGGCGGIVQERMRKLCKDNHRATDVRLCERGF